ncbi:hypothetical protein ACFQWH_05330 [Mycolicibacterium sp. GCM10028919]|uniref:hypothetical protein n=1 Tax=Mycolicibacterium sp. GCM10028919 TaxID=3273401 RepID=UPI00361DC812
MKLSARSFVTAGVALTAASAVAFTPVAIPGRAVSLPSVAAPIVSMRDVRLAVSAADLEAFFAGAQAVLARSTAGAANLAGVPGQNLIGVVDDVVTLIDTVFTGLIDSTNDQTLVASLTILKTLSVDAFAMLSENLGRINPVITTTTAQVGDLLTTALTAALRNVSVALLNLATDPFSPASSVGLITAGLTSGRLLAANGLTAVRTVGDAVFAIAGIALDEVTFQFNNAVSGLSALLTQLGSASGNAVVEAVIGAVRALAISPAVTVVNLGSAVVGTVLNVANVGFGVVLDGAIGIVDGPGSVPAATLAVHDTETAPQTELATDMSESVDTEAPTDVAMVPTLDTSAAPETAGPVTVTPSDVVVEIDVDLDLAIDDDDGPAETGTQPIADAPADDAPNETMTPRTEEDAQEPGTEAASQSRPHEPSRPETEKGSTADRDAAASEPGDES